jgi:hypothetical protein
LLPQREAKLFAHNGYNLTQFGICFYIYCCKITIRYIFGVTGENFAGKFYASYFRASVLPLPYPKME